MTLPKRSQSRSGPTASSSAFYKAVTLSRGSDMEGLESLLHDYTAAAKFQNRILQRKAPVLPTLDLAAYSRPAWHLGGDFHDFLHWGDSHLGIVVGDAMGKGLAASLLMMQARAVVRSMALVTRSPASLVRNANKVLSPDLGRGIFVTLLVAVLDLGTGEVRVANAGHPPMLCWNPNSGQCTELSIGGFALGVANESLFDRSILESTVRVEPGARFIMYSDGVTELQDPHNEEFGKGRLIRHILNHSACGSAEFISRMVSEMEVHRSGNSQSDDLTLVTGHVRPGVSWGSAHPT